MFRCRVALWLPSAAAGILTTTVEMRPEMRAEMRAKMQETAGELLHVQGGTSARSAHESGDGYSSSRSCRNELEGRTAGEEIDLGERSKRGVGCGQETVTEGGKGRVGMERGASRCEAFAQGASETSAAASCEASKEQMELQTPREHDDTSKSPSLEREELKEFRPLKCPIGHGLVGVCAIAKKVFRVDDAAAERR
eukprot:6186018-Pleurochrysis_carterae.AAC.3